MKRNPLFKTKQLILVAITAAFFCSCASTIPLENCSNNYADASKALGSQILDYQSTPYGIQIEPYLQGFEGSMGPEDGNQKYKIG